MGITAEYANPFPNEESDWVIYGNWEWTMKNDSTLCISFEENQWSNHDSTLYRSYYYFSTDTETNCVTLIDAKGIIILVDENGVESFPNWSFFDNITSTELQEFDINDKIVGKNVITSANGYQETYQFWVELTEDNHFEFNELELNSGLYFFFTNLIGFQNMLGYYFLKILKSIRKIEWIFFE